MGREILSIDEAIDGLRRYAQQPRRLSNIQIHAASPEFGRTSIVRCKLSGRPPAKGRPGLRELLALLRRLLRALEPCPSKYADADA
jgi:hypothetical protein